MTLADENPADELQGGHLIDVIHTALQHVTQPACGKRRQADRRRGLRLVVSRRTRQ